MRHAVGSLRSAISVNAIGVILISVGAICSDLPSGEIQLPEQ